ncbi:piggyBac transposable element-derived protein 4-like [Palaemon carinicauda]|uniref:piggyBac transposable element-derived protein 4-like n=1 Tax=Palaemon carinicauda TaxID=392227 RepID=UPI0035B5DB25
MRRSSRCLQTSGFKGSPIMASKRKRCATQQEIADILAEEDSETEDLFVQREEELYEDYEADADADEEVEDADEVEDDDLNKTLTDDSWVNIKNVGTDPPIKVKSIPIYSETNRAVNLDDCTPFLCFSKLFPNEIYDHVAVETNRYAAYMIEKMQPLAPRSRYRAWRDVDAGEIKAFIAIEITMGLVHKSSLASYFSKKFWLTETPGFSNIMSRDRYEIFRSCLHFADNSVDGNDDRLYKIKPILDMVKDLYSKYYVSGRDLSVDESMVKFKGRLFFKQYMPKKPTKWGIKVWSLCDSKTGYLLKFDVYTGKGLDSNKGKGLGASVVENLFEGFENKGHVVYIDSFFSGVPLFQKLRSKGTGACGTVPPNRKYLPSQMKKVKPKKGQLPIMWKSKDEELVAVVWQDSGRVNILSSVGDTGTVKKSIQSKKGVREVDKPSLQAQYNKYMGGVDLFDQFCSTYPFNHRSKKWYQTLAFCD